MPSCSGTVVNMAERARQVWYIVPRKAAAAFEAAVARTLGGDRPKALASLAAKHVMPALSPQELRALGVLRVVQPPGYAVVTLPVRAVLFRGTGVRGGRAARRGAARLCGRHDAGVRCAVLPGFWVRAYYVEVGVLRLCSRPAMRSSSCRCALCFPAFLGACRCNVALWQCACMALACLVSGGELSSGHGTDETVAPHW